MNTPVNIPRTTPGSRGEHELQERYGTRPRAEAFYNKQMLSYGFGQTITGGPFGACGVPSGSSVTLRALGRDFR